MHLKETNGITVVTLKATINLVGVMVYWGE